MPAITLPEGILKERCDKVLSQLLLLPRAHIRTIYEAHPFECNGKKIHLHDRVSTGDAVTFEIVDRPLKKTPKCNSPLDIIFEDDDIIIIHKPAGITVHPAPGLQEKTLIEYICKYCIRLKEVERSGIVHRLDKDTTGVMVFAKSNHAFWHLSNAFANHSIDKRYTCIVQGNPPLNTGKIEIPIARQTNDKFKMIACLSGKYAKTTWIVHERFQNFAWLDVKIYTGRTHQIRVHMNHIGHPIAGDILYGYKGDNIFPRVMLHAEMISFIHPQTEKQLTFTAPLPQDFSEVLDSLRSIKI
ncbi:MAG: RluA family pseudouridine synthase [Puniceicoccales bacterium]|jgi:23S rRNA pseudouridine1911/1915/1917 synthase|nr:RluA family pseudouridine synthase [Puniceicoccales bacterium]